MERHGKALGAQGENTDAHKLGIVLRKKQQDGPGEDADNERHSGNAGDACDHGKPERFPHAVKPLRAPREARHGLKALAEAETGARHKHGDAVGNVDRRERARAVGNGNAVEQYSGECAEPVAEKARAAHGADLLGVAPARAELPEADREQRLFAEVRRHEDTPADDLGYGRRSTCSRDAPAEREDKERVKRHIEHRARHHAGHGKNGAALGAQALVENKARRHERRGKQDVPAVLLRIRENVFVRAEQAQYPVLIRKTKDEHERSECERKEKAGREHLAGTLVLLRAEQARRKARRAHGKERARHHNDEIDRAVHADSARGVRAELTHEKRIGKVIGARNEHSRDGRQRHFRHEPGNGRVEHEISFCIGVAELCHGRYASFLSLCSGAGRKSGQYRYFPPPMNSRSSESFARRSGETSSKRSNAGRMLCSSLYRGVSAGMALKRSVAVLLSTGTS